MPPDLVFFLTTNPISWLAGYLLLYALGTNLAWWSRLSRLRPLIASFPLRGWFGEAARLVYCLILPYLALLRGVVTPQDMGLANLSWLRGLAPAAGLTIGGFLLVGWGWSALVRIAENYPFPENLALTASPWGWSYALRDAVYLQMSWAFCRAACMPSVGAYYGVFLGLGLLLLTGLTDPTVRVALTTPGKREGVLHTASLALVTTLIYLFTGNLILCAVSHFVLQVAVARWALSQYKLLTSEASEKGYLSSSG